jgi:hypothetical protein
METTSARLNKLAGMRLFAEDCDIYGRPLGGWAIPAVTSQHDRDKQLVAISMGTHRITTTKISCAYVRRSLNAAEVIAAYDNRAALLESCYDDLLSRLIDRLKELG